MQRFRKDNHHKSSRNYLSLKKLIKTKKAKIAVIGIGYVGQALAKASRKAGFATVGIDISLQAISQLNGLKIKRLKATSDYSQVKNCDIICVCVPTPISPSNRPDLKIIKNVCRKLSKYLRPAQLVIVESSVSPGTTKNLIGKLLEGSGLTCGRDYFLAHSPERIDLANIKYTIENTPKVVGAPDHNSQKLAVMFYQSFVKKVITVSSVEVAEMTKILENVFRFVNISLVNELQQYTQALKISIWEVIRAAATKPYGFLAHWPGPGIGGDCIPVLPYYLLQSAKSRKVNLTIVRAASKVNENQPAKIIKKAILAINGKTTPKALIIGVSYKPETADLRHSPALKIWEDLKKHEVAVSYHDPYVSYVNGSKSTTLSYQNIKEQDLIIIATHHKNIKYENLVNFKKPLIDTRNVLAKYKGKNIIRL
ncbi:nucleotide sugar dehydrogenase [Candidatus Curtissbacteria bacterium]|nr:nucleotide sugar dehydrogenase [Candidatus Curtissbacteria bacterium]